MRVVRLTLPLQLLVPSLFLPSFSQSTRALSLHPGRSGQVIGLVLLVASLLGGALLAGPTGPWGGILLVWLLGTAGILMVASSLRPTAFVKPICVNCRLLPVIKEHEAIHLSGVSSEESVWESMRTRYSAESLSLNGDPTVCSFCPIPKRLSGK
jgi:hypothetical protein